jgi:hypothetical protein
MNLIIIRINKMSITNEVNQFIKFCIQSCKATTKQIEDLYDYQKEVIESICNNKKVIILKARQMGVTSIVNFYALHKCIKNKINVVIVTTTNNHAQICMDNFINVCNQLHIEYSLKYKRNEINFSSQSSIKIIPIKSLENSLSSLRLVDIDLLILDEMEFFKKSDSLKFLINKAKSFVIHGTACNKRNEDKQLNYFYVLWFLATRFKMFHAIKISFLKNPEYANFIKSKKYELYTKKQLQNEFQCIFT